MKIVVDENMPYARELFSRLGEVRAVPGRGLRAADLADADALMVRSVTPIGAALLEGTKVRFVGTATAGTDHVDIPWLAKAGIGFSAAPGCNAVAVVEYVISSLLVLAEREGFALTDKTVGIIGVGNVGGRLQRRLAAMGIHTLLCDPPRADRGDSEAFLPLERLVAEADVLSFHTPLDRDGRYPTWHQVDADLLAALPDNRILINACRGAVVDNLALLSALEHGKRLRTVLDVWEPEPALSLPLLAHADIGTPHIAGYTLEGKARGTTQIYEAFSRFIGAPAQASLTDLLPPPRVGSIGARGPLDEQLLRHLAHLVYDVRRDDAALRRSAAEEGGFDRLRKRYWERREWSSLQIGIDHPASAEQLARLGFNATLAQAG